VPAALGFRARPGNHGLKPVATVGNVPSGTVGLCNFTPVVVNRWFVRWVNFSHAFQKVYRFFFALRGWGSSIIQRICPVSSCAPELGAAHTNHCDESGTSPRLTERVSRRVYTHLPYGPKLANWPMTCKPHGPQLCVREVKVCGCFNSLQHSHIAAASIVNARFLHFKRL
jgi:hypothetical protein